MKMYTIQVKDDGIWSDVEFSGKSFWESRKKAETAMIGYKNKFPFRITMRIFIVK
jgi:hypothetical protein